VQAGKFATVVGNFVPRHHSWENPFINAPLPYERVLTISDQAAPPTPAAFLNRRNIPDRKTLWVPLVWGPSYAAGASMFGSVQRFDYAFEVKNASISSRPAAWDPLTLGWEHPTASGRLGWRPDAAWNLGVSASGGTYLLPAAEGTLPSGHSISDYNQLTLGTDLSYAWRQWQLWAEVFVSRFEVPNVGNADTLAYYLEAKYKITAGLFAAVRWNQQFLGKVRDGAGGQERWDQDAWRTDIALGYRFTRHLQAKLQYSYNHQQGPVQQGEQFVAGQLTVKF
jgi:predicted porin